MPCVTDMFLGILTLELWPQTLFRSHGVIVSIMLLLPPNPESIGKSPSRPSLHIVDSSSVDNTGVVSNCTKSSSGTSSPLTEIGGPSDAASQRCSSSSSQKDSTCRVNFIRRGLKNQGVSKRY